MKLASIINVWADCVELLPFCIKNHLQFCDGVIVIWSLKSNHGADGDDMFEFVWSYKNNDRVSFHQLEPVKGLKPLANETRKRNRGIDIARDSGFTHFMVADADEFYHADKIKVDKEQIELEDLNGLVSPLRVYIGKPTLWCHDHTLVPTIHRLTVKSYVGGFKEYPFAYDKQGNAHIDPSRRHFYTKGIKMGFAYCHHYSYVRKNIDMKIDNSSANLKRSRQVIYDELRDAKPGYLSKLYHQPLRSCENYFNLPIWES
jgi:hypothetical protein